MLALLRPRRVSTAVSLLALCAASPATPAAAQASCAWDAAPDAPIGRIEGPSVAVDGKLYVFGGFYNTYLWATHRVDAYDPATDTWERKADMPMNLTHAGVVVDGGTVWFVGGFHGNHPGPVVTNVWKYDVAGDSWSAGPALPAPRGSGTAARLGRELHYYGGVSTDKETDLGDHFVLDLDNGTSWTTAAPLPVPRNHLGGAALGGKAYAIGGQFRHEDDPEDVDWVHAYDPSTDTWSAVAKLPFPRSHFEPGTFVLGGRLVIAGGRANTIDRPGVAALTAYDPVLDRWEELPPLAAGLVAPAADVVGDRIVLAGGGLGPLDPQVRAYTRPADAELGAHRRLDAGGPGLAGGTLDWCPDHDALGGKAFANEAVLDIQGTDDDALYRTERTGSDANPASFAYRFPLADGDYRVRLHFAEIWWGATGGGPAGVGRRVFDVELEGVTVLDDYDITADVGPMSAAVHAFDVAVTDGTLDLVFTASVDRPKLSALEILDLASPSSFCLAVPNSTGSGAEIAFTGSTSVAANAFTLTAQGCPPGQTGLFLQGAAQAQIPLGSGFLCLTGGFYRLVPPLTTDAAGVATSWVDLRHPPEHAAQVHAGSTWNFQLWYRDPAAGTSNLSDGLEVIFAP